MEWNPNGRVDTPLKSRSEIGFRSAFTDESTDESYDVTASARFGGSYIAITTEGEPVTIDAYDAVQNVHLTAICGVDAGENNITSAELLRMAGLEDSFVTLVLNEDTHTPASYGKLHRFAALKALAKGFDVEGVGDADHILAGMIVGRGTTVEPTAQASFECCEHGVSKGAAIEHFRSWWYN